MAGFRKPSVKKSFTARTTGRYKRAVKRATNPLYGKKGAGFVKDPERSVKNAVYHRTTVGGLSGISKSSKSKNKQASTQSTGSGSHQGIAAIIALVVTVFVCIDALGPFIGAIVGGVVGLVLALLIWTH